MSMRMRRYDHDANAPSQMHNWKLDADALLFKTNALFDALSADKAQMKCKDCSNASSDVDVKVGASYAVKLHDSKECTYTHKSFSSFFRLGLDLDYSYSRTYLYF